MLTGKRRLKLEERKIIENKAANTEPEELTEEDERKIFGGMCCLLDEPFWIKQIILGALTLKCAGYIIATMCEYVRYVDNHSSLVSYLEGEVKKETIEMCVLEKLKFMRENEDAISKELLERKASDLASKLIQGGEC
jgi:hypothetical protein